MTYPFAPDWVVPTSAMLREWLDYNHLATSAAAVIASKGRGTASHLAATALLEAVLLDQAIDHRDAEVLAAITSISAQFWLAFEHNYRTGLAAGKLVSE